MSATFPNGSTFAISGSLEAAKTVSGITSANPGVATATAHGYANGDILVLSNPSRLDMAVVRAANIATNTFELEGVDTTSTTLYPSGFGVGSVQRAGTASTGFTSLSQTVEVAGSGGEQQFAQWAYIEDGRQRQRPTFKNARSLTLTMHYDPALAWHAALLDADQKGEVRVLRVTLPNGSKLFYSVYVGFDGQPSIQINENMGVVASFALACPDMTRYAS
jgi:hypothetical protein